MSYYTDDSQFRSVFNQHHVENMITPDCYALHYNFCSNTNMHLPSEEELENRDNAFKALFKYFLKQNQYSDKYIFQMLQMRDRDVSENNKFKYTLLTPDKTQKSKEVIFLFHGLNEKSWQKYLPWAKRLMDLTGKSIILFPIAFHMDRAPQAWSNARLMQHVKKERQLLFPEANAISFVNTVISHRLQFAPQRLLLSGMQTYYDVLTLMQQIKDGTHPDIASNATIDIFAYSIGVMLGQILLMANANNWFDKSRMFLFAGGSVLNRMTPANKSILDDQAAQAVSTYYSKLVQMGNEHTWIQENDAPEKLYFKSLMHFDHLQETREKKLQEIGSRINGISLAQDRVISPMGILPTVEGRLMKTGCHVDVWDYDYSYTHETPFPIQSQIQGQVEDAFQNTFQVAARHLN